MTDLRIVYNPPAAIRFYLNPACNDQDMQLCTNRSNGGYKWKKSTTMQLAEPWDSIDNVHLNIFQKNNITMISGIPGN